MPTDFTPFASLGGGILIGIASVLLMANFGRVMGATGILAGFLMPTNRDDWAWRASLLAGMVSAPALYWLVSGQSVVVQVPISTIAMIIGGLIVGVGVTFGGGCTSGHGVCGIARLSPRSIVATVVFMIAAVATVYVTRHVIGGAI
ncbi:YeeE/YedE thiosulfate transporter family protein [Octadecabacter sp.]|nr:YeeE/YedE thiosulfate transporter family protein [Octadecabacter sp.]MDC1380637.1 YeeE/YedE thiosulfate transporter family protein [Octadecabacter sp.]MDC1397388.1 YeeE/YedE thiosulfate transporter family protein [Octadecabacter sp.]MDC1500840.1 YeeE/YedE thiosulfate transporter family protein [Octadecabacter sp.]